MKEDPIGACILYAMSCGLRDSDLTDRFELLARAGGKSDSVGEEDQEDEQDEAEEGGQPDSDGTGNKVRLRRWDQRKNRMLGLEGVSGRPVPLIDSAHAASQQHL